MKKRSKILAMLLTLMLCVGEFASTGYSVFAADDEITDTVSDAVSVDESDEETENVMFSSSKKFIEPGDSIEYGGSADEAWYPKSGSGGYIDSNGRERSIIPTDESVSKELKSIKLFHNDSNSRDYWVFGAEDFEATDSDNIFNTEIFRNDCLVFEIPEGKTVSDIPKGLYADDIVSWENNGRMHTTYYVVPYYGGKIIALDPGEGTGEMPSVELEDSAESYVLPECSFDAPEGKVFDKWDLGNPGDTIELNEEYTVITALWKYGSDIWIGDTQVTPDNMTSIPCDSGTASYNPATNTLTFNNAKLTTFSSQYINKSYAAVQSKGIPLKIKGNLEISGGTSGESGDLYYGMLILDSGSKATLDADITIKNIKSAGIRGDNSDIEISGGRIEVEGSESVLAKGNITLGDDIKVISPEGAEFKTISGTTRLWISNSGTETVVKDGAVIGSDKPLYTVTFNMNGHGDAIEPVKVTEGKTVAEPTAPIAEGWIFGGWYTDEACTTAYDFTTAVTADMTLYAKWTPISYTVKYDPNKPASALVAVSGTTADSTHTYDEEKALTANGYSLEGYTFGGWNTSADGSGTSYADKASVKNLADTEGAVVTLYAKWLDKAYEVKFDLNGKEGTAPEPEMVAEGGKVTEPAGITVPGYIIEGWYKEAACTNKWDFASDTVTANITLYAKWKPISYTVRYESNKYALAPGTVSGTTADSTHIYDEAKALTANGFSLEGYVFGGWNTMADGSGTSYADKASVKNLADTEGTVVTLYAQWREYSHSALDPVPDINDGTTEIWLVKGQKFTLQGFSLDDKDKDKLKTYKKLISISKKGKVRAKKTGTAVIVKKDAIGNVVQSISVNITKPELSNKKLMLEVGVEGKEAGSIALKNADHIDVYYYSASPDVAIVNPDGSVKAVAKGSAKITVYANGTAYTATVSVKEPSAVKDRTLHLAKDSSKAVKIGGVKKTVWDYAEGTTEEEKAVVSITGAKITAKKAGTVKLIVKGDLDSYTMTVKVDDISITPAHEDGKYDLKAAKGKNKYDLVIAAGQKLTLSYADMLQPVIYKSNKPETAFIDEYGNIEARSAGKAKFTAKVNGKTITINVNVK